MNNAFALALVFASLLLLGCIGGSEQPSASPSVTPTPSATSQAQKYVVQTSLSAFNSEKVSTLRLMAAVGVSSEKGVGAPAPQNFLLEPNGSGKQISSFEIAKGEQFQISPYLDAKFATVSGGEKKLLSPSTSFALDSLQFPQPPSGGLLIEVKIDLDASLHQTNREELAFLPVAEIFVSQGEEAKLSLGKFGMNEKGEVGRDKLVSPELKIIVSDEGSQRVFKVDDSPPQIPLE